MKLLLSILSAIATLAMSFTFSSCSSFPLEDDVSPYLAGYQPQTEKHRAGYWDGDGVTGEPMIKINIDKQQAYFYKGGQLVGQTPISTGIEGRNTPRGRYKVTQKSPDHHSNLYGVIKDNATGEIIIADAKTGRNKALPGQTFDYAPMTHFLRFNGSIGMHKGHLPGFAASHGCVRLPGHMAEIYFDNAKLGTPVIVE